MKICLKCSRKRKRGGACKCGGRMVVHRAGHVSYVQDKAILDWLEEVTDAGGFWNTITVHDSRDMGYSKGFVTVNVGKLEGKGNSLREALVDASNKPA